MTWHPDDTWIVIIGALAASACGLLGSFMVLRRMSMMGDAISHAVLPGLAAAFLIAGDRETVTMFVGAAVVGVATAVLTQLIHQWGKVDESASMGVVFTTLFALGLILLVRAADTVDLDPDCVLYGAIELATLDTLSFFGHEVPRSAFVLAVIALVDLGFVILLYKELKITSFDPALATTLGINATLVHYLLVALVAATVVAAFEAVGSILVVAMLIVPGATAHLLTDRLPRMLVLAVIVATLGAGLGHLAAITVPTWFGVDTMSTSGSMAVVTGLLFLAAVVAAPRYGVLTRLLHRTQLSLRIVREDALGLLYRLEEHGVPETANRLRARLGEALAISPLTTRLALRGLQRRGLLDRGPDRYQMTRAGRTVARGLVRSHRLWESYLVKHLALPADHVHPTAMRLEHVTSVAMQEDLAVRTDHPEMDPHGRGIPPDETRSHGGRDEAEATDGR